MSVSFGFHGPPSLEFKTDRLDLRGLDPGKGNVKSSPAQNFSVGMQLSSISKTSARVSSAFQTREKN